MVILIKSNLGILKYYLLSLETSSIQLNLIFYFESTFLLFFSCCAINLINFLENVKSLDSLHISHCWLLLAKNNSLREALEKHKESLINLGIGPVFNCNQQNQIADLPVDFAVFQHLTTLGLDHLWITDEALKQICDLKLLKRLVILLDKEFKGHGAKNETWECFHRSL